MKRKILVAFLVLIMSLPMGVQASSLDSAVLVEASSYDNVVAQAIMRDLTTGEETLLDAKPICVIAPMSFSDEEEITVGYEVFAPIALATALDTGGKSKETNGVTAVVYVTYTLSSNKEEIKVTNITGSWTTSNSLYYLIDREYGVSNGGFGEYYHGYPTTNSFNYNTNFGYYPKLSGDVSAGGYSQATIMVGGMESFGGVEILVTLQLFD